MQVDSWSDIARAIKRDDVGKVDVVSHSRRMNVSDGQVIVPAGVGEGKWTHLVLSELAQTQLCGRLGVPVRYYKTVAVQNRDLADRMLNHGLKVISKTDRRTSKEFLLRLKGRDCRAALSGKYSVFDNVKVAEMLKAATDERFGYAVHSCFINESGMYIKLICDELSIMDPDAPNSAIKAGIIVGNSETGARLLTARPFIYREASQYDAVCVPGRKTGRRHIFLSETEVRVMLTQAVAFAMRSGRETLNKALEARDIYLGSGEKVVLTLAKKFKYSERHTHLVTRQFQREPEDTAWGVINAFLAVTSYFRGDTRVEAETDAGGLFNEPEAFWVKLEEVKK